MAGKGGGAWKVAYADFVTAMMAFFLVMWITSQSDKVKQAIAHHFNDPFAPVVSDQDQASEATKPAKYAAPARPTPEEEKEAGGGGRTLVLVSRGGERTSIGTIVRFAEASVELDAAAKRKLQEFVPFVLGKPQRVEVRGHSTRRPLPPDSPYKDHWQLAYARCVAVMAALEELGVPRERLRLSQAAGNEPLAADANEPGATQARVEVNLLNETAQSRAGMEAASAPPSSGPRRVIRRGKAVEPQAPHAAHASEDHGHAPPAKSHEAEPAKAQHAEPHSGH